MEDPGWPAHRSSLTAADLEPVPVPVDDQGIRVDLLDALDVAAVIVTPAHQYPTGAVLSPDRRNGLVAWAHARSALIIEDDYDAEYRYGTEPVSCLQGMSPDHVIYAGTASKTLSPALRLAWLVLPEHLVNLVLDERTLAGPAPPPLIEAVVADLMDSGEWDRHLRRTRRSYRARRDVLVQGVAQHVPGIRVTGAAAGLHLLAWLPEGISEVDVAASAASAGIALGTLHRDCDVQAPRPPALLLGYAASPEPALLRAMERLGPCVARAARVMRADAAAVVRLRAMPRQTWCGRSPT